jgi:hypothetical protein
MSKRRLVALLLLLMTSPVPARAAWPPAAVGSWWVVEAWKHGLGEQRVTRVTTTLLRSENGVPWFEHINDAGVRWEDTGAQEVGDGEAPATAGGQDRTMTVQSLRLDGVPVECRVIMNEKRSAPWGTHHPVDYWLARTKRWEAIDTTLRVRVLKRLDLGTETHYRDGRIERGAGVTLQIVKTLHEQVRLHGRVYDCWVLTTKTLAPDSTFAGRTTLWGTEQAPCGWVRRIRETRDPRNGAMARLQEQVVDFRLK